MNERESLNQSIQPELEKIGREIDQITRTLSQTPDDHPSMPLLLACLGRSHGKRFKLRGEPEDINKAIEYATIALTLTANNDPGLPGLLDFLGERHGLRFQHLGEVDDSDKAIEYASLALSITPDGHRDSADRIANLGVYHGDRFQHLGGIDDLEKGIEYKTRALAMTPNDDPGLLNQLANLGVSHSDRFKHLGDLRDMEKSIEYTSQAVSLTPTGDPNLSNRLAMLAVSHTNRFERLGKLDDLEKAIECESRALALTPDGHPHLSSRLHNLGGSHIHRFERLGELGDIEKAIEYESRAVALTPDGHSRLSSRLGNLGASHIHRFKRLGEQGDLEKAIEYEARALALTPDGRPDLSSRLGNLGVYHSDRFECLGELADLDKAIEYESRALALTPGGHPGLSIRLGNLGASHRDRFERLGELADVEKAIEYQSRALALIADDHPDMPSWLQNLGLSHASRFELLGIQHDLEKSIESMSRALVLTPHAHPTAPKKYYPLANFYLLKYFHTGDPSHLHDSLNSYRNASQSLAGSPRDKFISAIGWANRASSHTTLNSIEAYQTAINLLPQFIWLGATTHQRYHDLLSAESLAVDAAHAAILISDHSLALEWLEHGRCVVWNQSLMLHSPLDQLHSVYPDFATRLKTVSDQLHSACSQSRESQALSSGSMTTEQVAQEHHRLAMEYNHLITEARNLPGFEDFLQPMKANKLIGAAQYGPIVVINCHTDRCDALVVMPGHVLIDHIPLPDFTGKKAQYTREEMEKSGRNSQMSERGVERRPLLEHAVEFKNVMAVLWYDVVKPILDHLGYTNNTSTDSLPHITWCPTGALSFLPLHAAGDYDQPQSRVFDYVISSYTPTLTALLNSTPSALSRDTRVLAIGQPNTPGHSSLPGTITELTFVEGHMLDKATYSQLVGSQATTTAVLDAMEHHDWVHLACHAHQNVQDPTKSGFFLHDDVLDIASINRRWLKNKGLAYLSACQTATGDELLPDEAVHLASGMLMAGYSSVIATMWSVHDDDAPLVADKVYGQLTKDGKLGNGEAGRALHNAVAELRGKVGEDAFGRWVPYIHIGS
ncbi:hypothetical protein FRC11_008341 [Ceratobasidium sp. 423]|nr:hypothetical protein FRC11_008341 [Ceratobasidium sp. 423]